MTLFTLSPTLVRGLACAVWLAVLIALIIRRPAWRYAPGSVRLVLAGLAIIGAGLLIGAVFTVLHRLPVSPDRVAAEAIGLIAGLFILVGILRYRPAPVALAAASGPDVTVLPTEPEDMTEAEEAPAVSAADASPPQARPESGRHHFTWQVNALERFQAEKQEAMAKLAVGLAHDFSNVLTVILTASEILLMDENLPQPLRRRVERMNGAAQRGADLANQLRVFAGRQELMAEEVDLHELLRASAVEFKSVVGPDIDIRYDLSDEPCPVMIDADQMKAALITVLVYCHSTLPEGGSVDFSTHFSRDPEPGHVDLSEMADKVVLTIARSGKRLSMEQAQRLLAEPYSSGSSSVAGGGFGLSLVAGFIHQSGGQVEFVEEPGVGPILEIRLPLAPFGAAADGLDGGADDAFALAGPLPPEPGLQPQRMPEPSASVVPASALSPSSPSAPQTPPHVLLVDDDDLMRESAAAELVSLGCAVTAAATPAEALDLLGRDPSITALVSDRLFQGEASGEWLVQQAQAQLPQLHVVLMSGDIAAASASASGEGRVVWLSKPFTRAQLAASLKLPR